MDISKTRKDQMDPMQIALETLTERCKIFEQRVFDVEAENLKLRLICSKMEDTKQDSLNELDILKQKHSQLREHNTQLKSNIQMVASENRLLWSRLTKLMEINQTLGTKLNNINDSLMQHSTKMSDSTHIPLIRSKTFTQNEPYLKYQQNNVGEENTKISLELEDISLKLISSIAKEKCELEAQCNEMVKLQSKDISNSFGFAYPGDDIEESVLENLEKHISDLKLIKESIRQEKQVLLDSINTMKALTVEFKCKACMQNKIECGQRPRNNCNELVENESKKSNTEEEKFTSIETSTSPVKKEETHVICPICSKMFIRETQFEELENHVEQHFLQTEALNNFEIL